ncbi:AAA family ATPase [Glaciibacter superstes]|uniref:AAA family ATPase n=1 Tax=Glaciibacter superstes TaxID=501023 RepID=UPI0003B56077|nr:LuxR family transcriptional regulator [Glaciibacter superstes]
MSVERGIQLFGRDKEYATLTRLVGAVRTGESQTIVLRGPQGIGKSTLLDYVADHAEGCRVERAVGIESELELAFAGLHQLCLPMLDHLDRLPPPQRVALSTAFGLNLGSPPDRFLVGLAVLSLFAAVAEERPLIALIDDTEWLDEVSVQVLAFVARRLGAESVALIFAALPGQRTEALMRLPELQVGRLQDADAHSLLDSLLQVPMDEAIRERIVADSRGCPLALIEITNGLTPAERAGAFGLPASVPLICGLEETYVRRLESLPERTRMLLLAAALEPTGDVATVWHAAEELGLGRDDVGDAEASGLVELSSRVRFRHPLVRSAVIRISDARARRTVHRVLASVTNTEQHPDRQAWHRALAAEGPDESVASELVRCAVRAQERGGLAASAAFLQAAAELTVDPVRRGERALAAAQAKYHVGASDEALVLLAAAEAEPLDDLSAALSSLLRGQIAFFSSRGREAPPLLIAAAQQLQVLDGAIAREAYLDAVSAGLVVGRFAADVGLLEVAEAASAAPAARGNSTDFLLDGFAKVITESYAEGVPFLKQALTAFRDEALPASQSIRWLWLASHAARDVWDDESWEILANRHVRIAREMGALGALPIALTTRIGLHVASGEIAIASVMVKEAVEVTAVTGKTTPPYGAIAVAAWQGNEALFSRLRLSAVDIASVRGDGLGTVIMLYAGAVLYNGLGDYRKALVEAESGAAHRNDLCYATWSLVELVEAASRSGEPALAVGALERLTQSTGASGTAWARGVEARCRALVSNDDVAESHYREAIASLGKTRVRMELARAHLLYGEWLRRMGRRTDARENLRIAHEMFTAFGADAYVERARRELAATGERVRTHAPLSQPILTAQEAQIAALAAAGRTNPEIAAELFLSSRTVEWHLGKVYPKLGIASRRELRHTLASFPSALARA